MAKWYQSKFKNIQIHKTHETNFASAIKYIISMCLPLFSLFGLISLNQFRLLVVRIEVILHLQLHHLFLPLPHFLIQRFEGLLQHSYRLFQWLYSLIEGLFDKHTANDFPAFPVAFQWLNVGQYQGVFASFVFELKVPFENLSVFSFELVVVGLHLLRDWHLCMCWII